ncbi:MAG: polyketide cyclase / dehydrase and lipid transport [Candidatus Nanopelagicales bacterium]
MPALDLVDETFVVVDRERIAAVVADPARWAQWWPDLRLTVFMDRGLDGIRWSATGAWVGSVEIWLEPVGDGVLLHHYLRLDRPGPDGVPLPAATDPRGRRRDARARSRRAKAWKRTAWALKDELEAGRAPGTPRPDGTTGAVPRPPASTGTASPDQ